MVGIAMIVFRDLFRLYLSEIVIEKRAANYGNYDEKLKCDKKSKKYHFQFQMFFFVKNA